MSSSAPWVLPGLDSALLKWRRLSTVSCPRLTIRRCIPGWEVVRANAYRLCLLLGTEHEIKVEKAGFGGGNPKGPIARFCATGYSLTIEKKQATTYINSLGRVTLC